MFNKDFFLKKTAQAFNSHAAAEILQHNIRKDKIERKQKSQIVQRDYKNSSVNKIADYLFKYAPKHDYWELLLDRFLTDMIEFDFHKTPSVNRSDEHLFNFMTDVENNSDLMYSKLNCFSSISLLEHTLDLFIVYHEILCEYESFRSIDVFTLLLACLLHDYGKNRKLQEKFAEVSENDYFPHQIISTKYIEYTLNEFEKTYKNKFNTLDDVYFSCTDAMNIVKNAVNEHHTKRNLKAKELVQLLIAVDHSARDYEWKRYLNEGKREWLK